MRVAPKLGAGGRDYEGLAESAIARLESVMRSAKGRAAAGHVTAAARELLTHCRWRSDREREQDPANILVLILGSEQAALEWMRDTLPKLEARMRAKMLAPPRTDE